MHIFQLSWKLFKINSSLYVTYALFFYIYLWDYFNGHIFGSFLGRFKGWFRQDTFSSFRWKAFIPGTSLSIRAWELIGIFCVLIAKHLRKWIVVIIGSDIAVGIWVCAVDGWVIVGLIAFATHDANGQDQGSKSNLKTKEKYCYLKIKLHISDERILYKNREIHFCYLQRTSYRFAEKKGSWKCLEHELRVDMMV